MGHYVLSSAPPSLLAVPKRGPSLHVYMGVTMFGLTRLVVVSGGSTPNKTYVKSIDRKTGRKNFYSGVCAAEYQERVLPVFAADGFELFSRKHSRGLAVAAGWCRNPPDCRINWAGIQIGPWWVAGPMASTEPRSEHY